MAGDNASGVITNPFSFYRHMRRNGGFAAPALFALAMGFASALVISLMVALGLTGTGQGTLLGATVTAVLVFTPAVLVASFVAGVVLHGLWRICGSQRSFETSYRCVAHTSALIPILALLTVVPYLAATVHALWLGGLLFIASTKVHKLSRSRALLMCGLLASVMFWVGLAVEQRARELVVDNADRQSNFSRLLKRIEQDDSLTPEQAEQAVDNLIESLQKAAREAEQD